MKQKKMCKVYSFHIEQYHKHTYTNNKIGYELFHKPCLYNAYNYKLDSFYHLGIIKLEKKVKQNDDITLHFVKLFICYGLHSMETYC